MVRISSLCPARMALPDPGCCHKHLNQRALARGSDRTDTGSGLLRYRAPQGREQRFSSRCQQPERARSEPCPAGGAWAAGRQRSKAGQEMSEAAARASVRRQRAGKEVLQQPTLVCSSLKQPHCRNSSDNRIWGKCCCTINARCQYCG